MPLFPVIDIIKVVSDSEQLAQPEEMIAKMDGNIDVEVAPIPLYFKSDLRRTRY